jgi:5-formyltetrahydrofolate cyclo-ligase
MPLKQDLRQNLKTLMGGMPEAALRAEGERAAAALRALPLWDAYRSVLLFLSTRHEIDTGPLLEAAFASGKVPFAPRTEGGRLRFHRIPSPRGPWERGPFGIREPAALPGTALEAADFPVLVVTPGLGFDRRGGRLGKGGGFYDRFFAEPAVPGAGPLPCFALGFCAAAQIVPEIPLAAHDKRMNALCTGAGEFFACEPPRGTPR